MEERRHMIVPKILNLEIVFVSKKKKKKTQIQSTFMLKMLFC